jgi:flagellar motor switch protein FliM
MTGHDAGATTGANPVLARMLGGPGRARHGDAADADPGPGRAFRVALLRAADRAIGLSLTVLGLSDDCHGPDALVADGPAGWVLFGLTAPGESGLAGLVMLDPALRTAMIEVQTMGVLMDAAETERPVTATDAVLARPVAACLLQELDAAGRPEFPAGMEGWTLSALPDLRAADLMLRDADYRMWEASVQIGGTDRQGTLRLALARVPATPEAGSDPGGADTHWAEGFRANLELSPTDLEAVLGRLTLPLSRVDAFETGQVLPLAGLTLDRVHLESAGARVARVRLGQVSGMRAVKFDQTAPEMEALGAPPPPAAAAMTTPEAPATQDADSRPQTPQTTAPADFPTRDGAERAAPDAPVPLRP